MDFPISVKSGIGILIGVPLNWYVVLSIIDIFTTNNSSKSWGQGSFHIQVSSSFSLIIT